jgi:hypothetical protein
MIVGLFQLRLAVHPTHLVLEILLNVATRYETGLFPLTSMAVLVSVIVGQKRSNAS